MKLLSQLTAGLGVFGLLAAVSGCGGVYQEEAANRGAMVSFGQEHGLWHEPEVDFDLPELDDPSEEEIREAIESSHAEERTVEDSPSEEALARIPEQRGVMTYRWSSASSRPDRVIPITAEDVLWMARMVYGEANGFSRHHQTLILFTAFQRHAYLVGRPRETWSLIEFMQVFSQPIKPAFANPNSEICRRYRRSCGPAKIARRQRIQSLQWAEIPLRIRQLVVDFVQGRIQSPAPRAIDFARSYGPSIDCKIRGQRVLMFDPPAARSRAVFCEPTTREPPVVSVATADGTVRRRAVRRRR